jgi:transcription termination/antitermination protein NusA
MLILTHFQNFIKQIAEEKGLDEEIVTDAFLDALAHAYRNDYQSKEERVIAKKNDLGQIEFYLVKEVVDLKNLPEGTRFNPARQISLEDAAKYKENPKVGDEILIPLPYRENFSRVALQIAKQVLIQKLRETEKESVYNQFLEKEGSVVSGVIERKDQKGHIYVNLGKATGILYKHEFIPKEHYRIGQRMRFYVYAVEKTKGGVTVYLSRAHPYFIPALFAIEVPEIREGVIQIKGVARDPGERSKMVVWTDIEGIDPIGACIGPKGARVLSISEELNGERIDVILWDPEPEKFVANALSPAKVVEVRRLPKRTMLVLVTEDQIPIAIGKNGQNIKLASRLTNWRIDVRSVERPEEPVEGGTTEDEFPETDTGAESA